MSSMEDRQQKARSPSEDPISDVLAMAKLAKEGLREISTHIRSVQAGALQVGRRFTCFEKLPPELRDKVWRFAGRQPRIIPVQSTVVRWGCDNHRDQCTLLQTLEEQSPLLKTCHESRKEVMKFMKPLHPTAEQIEQAGNRANANTAQCKQCMEHRPVPPIIYSNLDIDIFHFRDQPKTSASWDGTFLVSHGDRGVARLYQQRRLKNVMLQMDHMFLITHPPQLPRIARHHQLPEMYTLLLTISAQNVYCLLDTEEANHRDGTVVPYVHNVSEEWYRSTFISDRRNRMIRTSSNFEQTSRSPRKVKEINDASFAGAHQHHMKQATDFSRNMLIHPIVREEVKVELKHLENWKEPAVTYVVNGSETAMLNQIWIANEGIPGSGN